jgi:hypothetical protein
MAKSRIAFLVIATLVVTGSTLGAPAAFAAAATATHPSIIRTAPVPAPQLYGARMTQSHDHVADPFADLLLG